MKDLYRNQRLRQLRSLIQCTLCVFVSRRCADSVGGAAAMSGAADRDASPAAAGPAGLLPEEGRD